MNDYTTLKRCHYCDSPIVEGQHYILVAVALATDMPAPLNSPATPVVAVPFDTIHCMAMNGYLVMKEAAEDPRVQDTFDPVHG